MKAVEGSAWIVLSRVCRLCFAILVGTTASLLSPPLLAQNATGTSASPASTSLPADIPVKRELIGEATPVGDRWWFAIAIGAVLVATGVIVARKKARPAKFSGVWLRRFQNLLDTSSSAEIARVSSVRLSPHHSLHVVIWDGRRLLLGCSNQSVQLLAEAPSATEMQPVSKVAP
ncbi:flagellar biosynthetic protein FliO [Variovorax sp. OV700]|uniref:flagellar biosynthetic protein FliO n=1 Tax=Variovorax sp. OV700 TaxID=1882826 RepID=UPI000B826015|nr:flagellar biosynthetic protein FliO [Variovorax sp. OV700]